MPLLDDLPVPDPPDRDAADPDVLAGSRNAEELALVFAVCGHASGDLVTFGYEVLDHVIAGRARDECPEGLLPVVPRRGQSRERVVLDEVRREELVDQIGVPPRAGLVDRREVPLDEHLVVFGRHRSPSAPTFTARYCAAKYRRSGHAVKSSLHNIE